MKRVACLTIALTGVLTLTGNHPVRGSSDSERVYDVTITNLTRGQQFTPILVATHKRGVHLFQLGEPASPELEILAEEGDTMPLAELLSMSSKVLDVQSSGGLLDPGASVTVRVETRGRFDHISLAAMLIPTNDGFVALNGVRGPGRREARFHAPAYDAGSEVNDELCASIPGPGFSECGGPGGGGMPVGGEEGYVHIHAGIHGIGDLDEASRDWRNPVAEIVVRRVDDDDDDDDNED